MDTRPTRTPVLDLRPTRTPVLDLRPTRTPVLDLRPTRTPPLDLRPTRTPLPDLRPTRTPPPGLPPTRPPRRGLRRTRPPRGGARGPPGAGPRARCYTWPNDPPRLSRYAETEFLHQTHVTEHKVECLNCHVEVSHRIPAREEALAADCRSCHSTAAGHSAVRDLYRGIGGKGVEPRPASMYLAGIRCEACHGVRRSDLGRADEVSCMSCHGPKYLTIYRNWQVGLAKRLDGVRAELDDVRRRAASADGAARELLTQAEENVALVERGREIHNPGYAVDLLKRAQRDNAAALATLG